MTSKFSTDLYVVEYISASSGGFLETEYRTTVPGWENLLDALRAEGAKIVRSERLAR